MSSAPAPHRVRSLLSFAAFVACVVLAPWARASLGDEPRLDPRMELDPRTELDPRVDRPDPPRAGRAPSPVHAPLWIAIGTSFGTVANGVPFFGAELQLGIPLDRLAMRGPRAAIAEDARTPRATPPPAALPPAALPGRGRKLDLTPPPPPPKLVVPEAVPETPLRVPVVVTPAAARAAVDAALRRAHLLDPDARIDALALRARQSAGLPELRLRILRTADDGQTLSPVSYDPNRIVAVDTINFWAEARATWKLDRAVFAEEEVALERMRHERAAAQSKLTKEVLRLLFEWQRARAHADNPLLPADENLTARLKLLETAAELDILTDGWFSRWRGAHAAPDPDGPPEAPAPPLAPR
jgi:hypothetical protein